jgi:hypothetical protein
MNNRFLCFWSEGSGDRFDDSVWTNWSNFEGYIPNDRVYVIKFDHLHRVWVGTDSWLAVYDGKTWTQYNNYNTPLKKDFHVKGIAFDKDTNVWFTYNAYYLGRFGGVGKFDGITWKLYRYQDGKVPTPNLSDNVIEGKITFGLEAEMAEK